MGLSAPVRARRPAEIRLAKQVSRNKSCIVRLRDHPQHDPGKSFTSMRAMRRLRKPSIRPGSWRAGGASDCARAAMGTESGEAIGRRIMVSAAWRRGLAARDVRDDCKCGASSITLFFAGDGALFFIVAQYPAGRLVDEMDPGTCRAGHGFIAIRISRRGIGHVDLNAHAGPRAAKYQFAHFFLWRHLRPCALICLKAVRPAHTPPSPCGVREGAVPVYG